MGNIISVLLTAGMFCIIVGAVFGDRGKGLRRAGVGLLVLTFLPVVLFGILNEVLRSSGQHGAPGAVPTLLGALVVIIAAYGITRLLQQRPEKPRRAVMKRPYVHRRDNGLIDFLRREIGGDE